MRAAVGTPAIERVLMYTEPLPWTGCWIWIGAHQSNGYGNIKINGNSYRVHRVVYEALVGPIPDGLHLDHLCRVRDCCNPAHLEPVTNQENCQRGERCTRMICPKGHALTPENIRYESGGRGQPRKRSCLACLWERRYRTYAKRREASQQP